MSETHWTALREATLEAALRQDKVNGAATTTYARAELELLLSEVRRLRALARDDRPRTEGWFSYSPDGIDWHDDPESAERAAEFVLDACRDDAEDDGWDDFYVETICWGEVRARAVVVSRGCRGCGAKGTADILEHDVDETDEECSVDDETVDYGLRPVRSGP